MDERTLLVVDMEGGGLCEYVGLGDGIVEMCGESFSEESWFKLSDTNGDKVSRTYELFGHLRDVWQNVDNVIVIAEEMPFVPLAELRGLKLSTDYVNGLFCLYKILTGKSKDALLLDIFREKIGLLPCDWKSVSGIPVILLEWDDITTPTRKTDDFELAEGTYYVVFKPRMAEDWKKAYQMMKITLPLNPRQIGIEICACGKVSFIFGGHTNQVGYESFISCN